MSDFETFVENTLLLLSSDDELSHLSGLKSQQCDMCKKLITFPTRTVLALNTESISSKIQAIKIQDLVDFAIKNYAQCECCQNTLKKRSLPGKSLVLKFSHNLLLDMDTSDNKSFYGMKIQYQSHMQEVYQNNNLLRSCFFSKKNTIYYQNSDENICVSNTTEYANVKMLSINFSNKLKLEILKTTYMGKRNYCTSTNNINQL